MQVGKVLDHYSLPVIDYVSDPITGVQVQKEFPPTLKEIKDACDQREAYCSRMAQAMLHPRRTRLAPPELPTHPGCRANLFVPADNPRYEAVHAWCSQEGTDPRDWKHDPDGRPGLWIGLHTWDNYIVGSRGNMGTTWKAPSDAELRAQYGTREAKAAKEQADAHE